jgi:FixJ family two-component response regulator
MAYQYLYLLDDNETTNFYNTDVIKDTILDCEVECFTSARLFIDHFKSLQNKENRKILLLLDINMPDMQGFEVIEELEEKIDNLDCLDIIMVSSSDLKIDKEKATKYPNIMGFIEKPLTIKKLDNAINGVF